LLHEQGPLTTCGGRYVCAEDREFVMIVAHVCVICVEGRERKPITFSADRAMQVGSEYTASAAAAIEHRDVGRMCRCVSEPHQARAPGVDRTRRPPASCCGSTE